MGDNRLHVYWHPAVLSHDTGQGLFEAAPAPLLDVPELHPENAERVQNMKSVLERGPIRDCLRWHDGRLAETDELAMLHAPQYVELIRALSEAGGGRVTSTTVVGPGTWTAACAAAGTAIQACQDVIEGRADRAYALVRPPGHHAQPCQADGYCFFNNVALAAEHAVRSGAAWRAAIIDWDVHHGNGTQACFYDRADVLTVSLHMRHGSWGPSHPQTGSPAETGVGKGAGYNVNVELPMGCGDIGYTRAMAEVVGPIVDQFEPDMIFVASGQDCNQFDPNGRMLVSMDGFHALSRAVRDLADRHTGGRFVAVQEGGYARTYSAYCLHATLEGMLGEPRTLEDPLAFMPEDVHRADEGIAAVQSALSRRWRFHG